MYDNLVLVVYATHNCELEQTMRGILAPLVVAWAIQTLNGLAGNVLSATGRGKYERPARCSFRAPLCGLPKEVGIMAEYVKYGDEWRKEVMKNPKSFIVDMLRRVALERDSLVSAQQSVEPTVSKRGGFPVETIWNGRGRRPD